MPSKPNPHIFRASDSFSDNPNPRPKFPFDNKPTDDYSEDDYECGFCHGMISDHTTRQIVQCSINILKGGVKT